MASQFLFMKVILLILLSACSTVSQKSYEIKIGSKINKKIQAKNENFLLCAKDHKIFKQLDKIKSSELSFIAKLAIGHNGNLESFTPFNFNLKNDGFLNCIYDIFKNINYPKFKEDLQIEVNQPIIIKKKENEEYPI